MEVGNTAGRREEEVPDENYRRRELVQHVAEELPVANLDTHNSNYELAVQFVRWFYKMLNACNAPQTADGEEFGVQHFYDDCSFRLLYSTYEQSVDEFKGAQVVCDRLRAFVCEEQLQFNANTDSDGTMGMSYPHGLKMIVVCGTVHVGTQVVGIFEQQFGLVRDPSMDNNWRIKFTNLKLLSKVPQQRLTLQETENMMTIAPSYQVVRSITA